MIEFTLPWPLAQLSPNARLHWAKVARAKKQYRKACWATCLEQMPGQSLSPAGDHPGLTLTLTFVPPDRRSYDRDNLMARMKSGIDGMCDAIKIDDKAFHTVISTVAADQIGGFVKVTITGE